MLLSTQVIAVFHSKGAPSLSIYDTITKCFDLIGRNGTSKLRATELVRCLPLITRTPSNAVCLMEASRLMILYYISASEYLMPGTYYAG